MPCNKLAVQTANIQASPQLIAAVFANPMALDAIAQTMKTYLTEDVTVWDDKTGWWEGYRTRRQSVALQHIARPDAEYMDFCSNSLAFRIYADGRIEARDPWTISYQHPRAQEFLSHFTMTVATVAVLTGQQLIAATLAQAGLLRTDSRTDNARILTVAL